MFSCFDHGVLFRGMKCAGCWIKINWSGISLVNFFFLVLFILLSALPGSVSHP